MAITITKTALPASNAGFNLTDADYTVLDDAQALDGGYVWEFAHGDIVVLASLDSDVQTHFDIPPIDAITQYNGAIEPSLKTIQDGDIYLFRLDDIMKNSDGEVTLYPDAVSDSCGLLVFST